MVGNMLERLELKTAMTASRQRGTLCRRQRGTLCRRGRCLLRVWPILVMICLMAGCALNDGARQWDEEARQGQPSSDELSGAVRRLPPVFDPAEAPSLAGTDPASPGVPLENLTESQSASENPREAQRSAPAEMPAPQYVAGKTRHSQTVPAVFRADPDASPSDPLSAQAIPTQWRQWPEAVTNVSNDEPSGRSVVTDVSRRPPKTALQVQFAPTESLPAQPIMAEPMAVPEPENTTPVTLRCDGVDVRKVLEMLSVEASTNILVAPGVTGQMTANLQGLTFDEALGAILKLCNLVAHREHNLILVYPLENVPQLARSLQAFPLDYVSSQDALLGVQGLLSPTGQAFLMQSSPEDNRRMQDMIVVDDLPDHLFRIEQYLTQIDRPPRQVLIEVHVLEVELSDTNRHGVNFDHTINILRNTANLQLSGFANPLAGQAFFVNVDGANLDALIECLRTTSDAKTLASPRVLVLNGQQARIQIGEQLGYRVITTTETASMEEVIFLELGVVLDVTPHISRDNQIVMRVKPQVSSGQINPETALPEEQITEVETDVLLMDGQGMVIGGLIRETDSIVQSKIPVLGDIWMLGWLFKRREVVKRRTEIIITLIPRVVPYLPEYEMQHEVETARAATPLLHGPLCRYPRPWEPSLPDAGCRLRDLR